MTESLLILATSYGVPLCTYNIFDMDMEQKRVPALFWDKGTLKEAVTSLPSFTEFQFGRQLELESEALKLRKQWLQKHTVITDNPAVPKEALSMILMKSELSVYAIPTYSITSAAQLQGLCKIIPHAILKPSGGKKGIGVMRIHKNGDLLTMEEKEKQWVLNEHTWASYLNFIKENRMGRPILQPRLDFSLDERHAVDFRLLVARGGNGDWQTVAIYPRIGASHLVSNVAQGGYIGDTTDILRTIAGDEEPKLLAQLERIARELPVLVQSHRSAPITALGIDVGIDRSTLQPYILEANSRPSTKLHLWLLAQTKIQYYHYLLCGSK